MIKLCFLKKEEIFFQLADLLLKKIQLLSDHLKYYKYILSYTCDLRELQHIHCTIFKF